MSECDHVSWTVRWPWPTGGLLHHGKKNLLLVLEDGGNRLPRNDGNFTNRDGVMEGFTIPQGPLDG